MLGNVIWDIGRVSIVVEIGLWCQLSNDMLIKYPAAENPPITIIIQNNLDQFLTAEM